MTRVTAFLILGTLTCWAAFGGSAPENTIYRGGSLTGVSPNSSGMLLFPNDQAMVFQTGDDSVRVPYARISKAELGAPSVHSPQVPLYKVWALSKRFNGKNKTQLLTVAFKGDKGEDVSMTFDLAQSAAPGVLATINGHTGKGPAVLPHIKLTDAQVMAAAPADSSKTPWWGDDYWKTTTNSDKWNPVRAATTPQP